MAMLGISSAYVPDMGSVLFDDLVPIAIDVTVEGVRYTDAFCWSIHEADCTPEAFAKIIVIDQKLNHQFISKISTSINEQLGGYAPYIQARLADEQRREKNGDDLKHEYENQLREFEATKLKRRKLLTSLESDKASLPSTQWKEQSPPFSARSSPNLEEKIQPVRLYIRLGRVVLKDQFEWDINNPENSPESFAAQLCADIGLGSESISNIAHAIRQQIHELRVGQYYAAFDETLTAQANLASVGGVALERRLSAFPAIPGPAARPEPVLPQAYRVSSFRRPEETVVWQPVVECLSIADLEKIERKELREARVQRRSRGRDGNYVPESLFVDAEFSRRATASPLAASDDVDTPLGSRRTRNTRRRG